MLKIYIKIALRNLTKNRLFSVINIAGLALSMSVGLVFILNIKKQFDYDRYQPHPERTFRIITDKIYEKGTDTFATTPDVLAQKLRSYAFVEKTTRLHQGGGMSALVDGKELSLSLRYADSTFLTMFDFGLVKRNDAALAEPNSIILSQKKARDFWGEVDPVGKVLTIPGKGNFKVTGVIKENTSPSHFNLDAIASSSSLKDTVNINNKDNWADLDGYTYIVLRKGATEADLAMALKNASLQAGSYLKAMRGNKVLSYAFVSQNLLKINPSTRSMVIDEMNRGMDWGAIAIMAALILLLMVMVGFNYTGLSLARSISRAKEVGVRKINGAKRYQIFAQFLTESMVLTVISLVLACFVLPLLVNIPLFKEILEGIQPDAISLLWVVGFALMVGLMAGGMPAWLLSSFKPLTTLQKMGNYRVLGGVGFRKVLITIQFTITSIFVTFLIISREQIDFERDFNYGFVANDMLYMDVEQKDIETLKSNFAGIASVGEVSATSALPLRQSSSGNCFVSSTEKDVDSLRVEYYATDSHFIPNLQIELLAGTNFPADLGSTDESVVILNEKAIKQLKFKSAGEAIGQFVKLDSAQVQIIGVYKDFVNWNVRFGTMPFALRYRPAEFNQLLVKISPHNRAGTVAALGSVWKKLHPQQPFKYEFYDEFMKARMDSHDDQFLLFDFLTALVMGIACLGLVGMVAYTVELRVKEIGVRKTLGAAAGQLIWLVSRDFMKILLWAGILALPAGYYIGYSMLKEYAYRIDLSAGLFLTSFLSMFVIGLLTILSQTFRVSYINPVESLRAE